MALPRSISRTKVGSVSIEFNNFPYIRQAMIWEVQKATKETADEVRDEARRLVPVRTGRLRDSLRTGKVEKDTGADPIRFAVNLTTDVFYWVYVEYGTRRMSARPYIRPAVEWGQLYLSDRVKDAVLRATIAKGAYRPWKGEGDMGWVPTDLSWGEYQP